MTDRINKYSLKEWIKHPTTIMLIVAMNVIWILIFIITDSAKTSSKECMEQVMYLRERVEKLEAQTDAYTRTVLFKDMQIKKQSQLIDSLYRKESLQ